MHSLFLIVMLIAIPLRADTDGDGDGWSSSDGDCDDNDPATYPGAAELCDGRDNRCQGWLDDWEVDADGDGYALCDGDCDDSDPQTHSAAAEEPNGLDDDCDGLVDEGTSWGDDDGDGWSQRDGDCDASDPLVHPHAEDPDGTEAHGIDDDCDGLDNDGDGDVDADGDGYSELDGDCDDSQADVHPGAEDTHDGRDNDCDGSQPPVYGCESNGQALLLFPFLGFCARRRRLLARCAVLSLVLLLLTPSGADAATQPYLDQERVNAGQEHDALLVRAALLADMEWAMTRWHQARTKNREELERQLRIARQARDRAATQRAQRVLEADEAQAGGRAARRRARAAETTLDPQRQQDLEAVREAFSAEDRLWNNPALEQAAEARENWGRVALALQCGQLWAARYWLDVQDEQRWELSRLGLHAEDRQRASHAASGQPLRAALDAWLTAAEDAGAALEASNAELVPAGLAEAGADEARQAMVRVQETTLALAQMQAAMRQLEERIARLDQAFEGEELPSLHQEAERLFTVYDRLRKQASLGRHRMSQQAWSDLHWRAGSAAMLAGRREEGRDLLRQAAAVTSGEPPSQAYPPWIACWFERAEAEVARLGEGELRVGLPEGAFVTVNGVDRQVDGDELVLKLPTGSHRLEVAVPGANGLLVQLLEVFPGEATHCAWYDLPGAALRNPLLALTDDRPAAERTPAGELSAVTPSPWRLSVTSTAWSAHSSLAAGASLGLGWRATRWGLRGRLGLALANEPIWTAGGRERSMLGACHLAGGRRGVKGRLQLDADLGAFWHPGMAAGPLAQGGLGIPLRASRLRLELLGGWDLIPHQGAVQRWLLGANLGIELVLGGGTAG